MKRRKKQGLEVAARFPSGLDRKVRATFSGCYE